MHRTCGSVDQQHMCRQPLQRCHLQLVFQACMYSMTAHECGHVQVLYAARRGFYFVLPKPGTQQPKGKDGERSDPAGA